MTGELVTLSRCTRTTVLTPAPDPLEVMMTTIDLDSLPTQRSLDLRTVEPLTRRERVILSNLDEATTLEEIATRLFVTRNTVKSQVRSVYRKLGVSTRADAVACARQIGLR